MSWVRPIAVRKDNLKVGQEYWTCQYSGTVKVTLLKVFKDGNVLVKTKKSNTFVRNIRFIFDNQEMARSASREWERNKKKQKNKK